MLVYYKWSQVVHLYAVAAARYSLSMRTVATAKDEVPVTTYLYLFTQKPTEVIISHPALIIPQSYSNYFPNATFIPTKFVYIRPQALMVLLYDLTA